MKIIPREHSSSTKISDLLLSVFTVAYFVLVFALLMTCLRVLFFYCVF